MRVFLDLECAPDLTPGALERCIASVEPPGQYKKADSIAQWKAENAQACGLEAWQKTALDPMRGSIYVFGFSIDGEDPITLHRKPEDSEAMLLNAGLTAIGAALDKVGQNRPGCIIGWNILNFDLPFLAKRCVINRVTPSFKLPLHSRYNSEHVIDLMTAWAGYRDYAKQSEVAKIMGIPLSSEIEGKDLWAFVEKNGVEVAAAKCRSDLGALIDIYNRMAPVFRI